MSHFSFLYCRQNSLVILCLLFISIFFGRKQSPECYLRSSVQLTDSKSDLSEQMWLFEAIGKGLGNHTSFFYSLEEESMRATKGGASNEA